MKKYRISYNEYTNTYRIQKNWNYTGDNDKYNYKCNDKWETYGTATHETEAYEVLSRLKQADEESHFCCQKYIIFVWDVIHEE